MRKVELLISASKGALPVLVAVTIVPMAATCSSTTTVEAAAASTGAGGNAGAGGEAQGGKGGAGGQGGLITVGSSSSSSGAGGGVMCSGSQIPISFTVEVPPQGTPADPGQICAIAMDPVTSNLAAKVTLTKSPMADHLATGFVAIDPALAAQVMGTPTIAVVSAGDPQLSQMQVTNIAMAPGGFSFDAAWPTPFNVVPYQWETMTVKVSFYLLCDPQAMTMRWVEAITHINLCIDNGELAWVSSGEVCNACDIIAEMAPSPIVPEKCGDDLPLGTAMRLRLVPLARIGASVVLLAENDGGEGLSYAWHPSAGTLVPIADDIVIWTPPPDLLPHILQVAVEGEEAAAVATYAWREAS